MSIESSLHKIAYLLIILSFLATSAIVVSPVSAATIVVNSTADVEADDGYCTLREAIKAANSNIASGSLPGECAAGSVGADSITLPAGIYTLTSQLPIITSEITINGADAETTIIQASACNPITLPGSCTPADYQILSLNTSGVLSLHSLTLRYGNTNYGGAVYNNGTLNIENSIFSENKANNGGAIYNYFNATVNLTQCNIIVNAADASGGGIFNYGTLSIDNTLISGNIAHTGAGVSNSSLGNITIVESIISNNHASSVGGGINNQSTSILNINSSTIAGNTANNDGGGIYNSGVLTINNSTFTDNQSVGNVNASGGGIRNFLSTAILDIRNSTFSENTASKFGGGISNVLGGTLNIINTIIANSQPYDCYNSTDSVISGDINNLFVTNAPSPNHCGDPIMTSDPLLGVLADNGGPTSTHALKAGSPAIDAAHSEYCPEFDQRGVSRPQGAGCDIGAYERESQEFPPNITSADSTTFIVGTYGTFTVTTTGNPTPTIDRSGNLPSGVTFTDHGNGTATLAGTPGDGTAGNYPLTLTAINGILPNAKQTFTLTVTEQPGGSYIFLPLIMR